VRKGGWGNRGPGSGSAAKDVIRACLLFHAALLIGRMLRYFGALSDSILSTCVFVALHEHGWYGVRESPQTARTHGGSRPIDHRYVQILRVTGSALSSYFGLCAKLQPHVELLTEYTGVSRQFTT
jgi:hypothetical protein